MSREKKLQRRVLGAIVGLVIALLGGILIAALTSGWFDDEMVIPDAEYRVNDGGIAELSIDKYNELVSVRKSFIVFIDQDGCTTADRMREYVTRYSKEHGLLIYRMMFADMKETSMHETIKYYPSVAIISKGKVVGHLRADSDEDAEIYNNYEAFEDWMGQWIK